MGMLLATELFWDVGEETGRNLEADCGSVPFTHALVFLLPPSFYRGPGVTRQRARKGRKKGHGLRKTLASPFSAGARQVSQM